VTSTQIIGLALVAMPFAAIFALGLRLMGLLPTLAVFALTALVVAVVLAGSYLLTGGK